MQLSERIYNHTSQFPRSEMYGLTAQMRSAAVSIPSNIAEGQARGSSKEFLHFLTFALGSLAELETQLELAARLQYEPPEVQNIQNMINLLGKKLHSLQASIRHRALNTSH